MRKHFLFITLCLVFSKTSFCQEDTFMMISNMNANDTIMVLTDSGKETIKYLGAIYSEEMTPIYHVITVFSVVQAANVKHGHSQLIYLDLNYHVISIYTLGMPTELPYKLLDNQLYFKHVRKNGTEETFVNNVGKTPPKVLCVSRDNCY